MSIFGGLATAASNRQAPAGLVAGMLAKKRSVATDAEAFFSGGIFSSPTATGIPVNQQTALSLTAFMGGVRILAEDVSKMGPGLYARRPDGGRNKIETGALANLLWQPNGWQTWPEFCRQMVTSFVMRGNAWAVIVRDGRGDPTMLVPIHPDKVGLWQSPDGSLFWHVSRTGLHQMAVLRGIPFLVPYADVFHLKDLSADGLIGQSPISLAREAIGLGLAYEQQQARLMGNGARPSGVLSTERPLTEEVAARLKENWKQLHGGLFNTGQVAVLEAGLKWTPLSLSPADLQFIHLRQFQVIEMCRILRIPPHMLGDLTRGTYQNIVQQAQEYRNNTLTSHSDIWERRMDLTFGLRAKGLFVDFDETTLLKADLSARYMAYRIGRLSGWLTTNEIRLAEGLDPVEGGDELMQPLNMGPIDGSDMTGAGGEGGGRPKDGDIPEGAPGQ